MKKLYSINNGELEIVTLLNEHNLCEGATVETYLCKDASGKKFICSKDLYKQTELEAWNEYSDNISKGLVSHKQEIYKLRENMDLLIDELFKVNQRIKFLTAAKQ